MVLSKEDFKKKIDTLEISDDEKIQLNKYYDKVWSLVTSGEIKLECDLHFTDGTTKYVVDFKHVLHKSINGLVRHKQIQSVNKFETVN